MDESPRSCTAIPVWTPRCSAPPHASSNSLRATKWELTHTKRLRKLKTFKQVAAINNYYKQVYARYRRLQQTMSAIDAVQQHLACDGVKFNKASKHVYTWQTANGVGAFILSTQLAATALNHACGNLKGIVFVLVGGNLVSLDDLIADAVALLKDPYANDTGPQASDPGLILRAKMIALADVFDGINANSTPVYVPSTTICPFVTPYGL